MFVSHLTDKAKQLGCSERQSKMIKLEGKKNRFKTNINEDQVQQPMRYANS